MGEKCPFSFPNTTFFVQRCNLDGSSDKSFGQGSFTNVDFGFGSSAATKLTLQPDGKIVAIGTISQQMRMVRINADGSLDPGFGVNGKVRLDVVSDVTVAPDGKILVAGTIAGNTQFELARLDPDGSPDTRFGSFGLVSSVVGVSSFGLSVAIQGDSKIVEGGATKSGDLGLIRFMGGNDAIPPHFGTGNQQYVAQLYLDLLGRPADPIGLSFFSGAIDTGLSSRLSVARAMMKSPEYSAVVVQRLYGQMLGRSAEPSGLATWTNFLAQGGTSEELSATIAASPEYGDKNVGYLNGSYRDFLYRSVDTAGGSYWSGQLEAGKSFIDNLLGILASPESDTVETTNLYHQVLHRAPDAAGLANTVNALQHGITNEEMEATMLASDEYFSAAQH